MDSSAIFLKNFQAGQRGVRRQSWAPYEPLSSSSSLGAAVTRARGTAHIHRERKKSPAQLGNRRAEQLQREEPMFLMGQDENI